MQHSRVRWIRSALLFTCCALACAAAIAQPAPLAEAQPEPAPADSIVAPVASLPVERWYQIELIVLRHLTPITAGGATSRPTPEMPDYSDALSLIEDVPQFDDELLTPADDAPATPIAFQRLPDDQLALASVYQRLGRSGEVEPLLHIGWRQPSFGTERARRIRIPDRPALSPEPGTEAATPPAPETTSEPLPGESLAPRFDGAVRLRIGRYLVFDADFVFQNLETLVRLNETRRLMFGEIHYFDDPNFGLLVQVTPFAIAAPGDATTAGMVPTYDIEAAEDDAIIDPDAVPDDETD